MATEATVKNIPGLKAAADYSAAVNQYRAVDITAANIVTVVASLGAKAVGILYNKPTAGAAAQVASLNSPGPLKAKAGAAIAAGAKVSVAADGDFVTWLTTHHAVGIAKTAAAADQDIFELIPLAYGID